MEACYDDEDVKYWCEFLSQAMNYRSVEQFTNAAYSYQLGIA